MWQHKTTNERLDEIERFFERLLLPAAGGTDHAVLHHLIQMEKRLMSALTDLKDAIAELGNQLATNNAEIETLLTKITTPGTSDADIQDAVASIRSLTAANKAEVDKAAAAAP